MQLLVLNMILGGQFVSRINMNLREDKGYTYGARTGFECRRGPGPVRAPGQRAVRRDRRRDCTRALVGDRARFAASGRSRATELEIGPRVADARVSAQFRNGRAGGPRRPRRWRCYDLPDDYFSTFVPKVLAHRRDGRDGARRGRHLDPSRLLTVVVGDRDRIGPTLASLELGDAVDLSVPV